MRDFRSNELTRRHAVRSFAGVGGALFLLGCGGSSGSGTVQVPTPTPTPTPPPTPTPIPTPTPTPVSSPITIVVAGSSSAQQYLELYDGPASNAAVSVLNFDGTLSTLVRGAFGKTAGALIHAATGRPVRFVGGGIGGTTLLAWASPESSQRAALVAKIRLLDKVDCALIQIGRNDAGARIIKSPELQLSLYKDLIAAIRRETGYPSLPVFIGASQNVRSGDAAQLQQLGWQRMAELMLMRDDATIKLGFSTYDLATFDGLHQTEQSQVLSGTRFAKCLIDYLSNIEPYSGPIIERFDVIDNTSVRFFLRSGQSTHIIINQAASAFEFFANEKRYSITNVYKESEQSFVVQHESRNGINLEYTYAMFSTTEPLQGIYNSLGDRLPLKSYSSLV